MCFLRKLLNISLLFVILTFGCCSIQKTKTSKKEIKTEIKTNYIKYFSIIAEAANLFKLKRYKESAQKYEEAFIIVNNNADTSDRYKAACANALANNINTAFYHLFYIAEKDKYTKLETLKANKDFDALHRDKRWEKLLLLVKKNKDFIEKDYNQELVSQLDTIYQNDQNCRTNLDFVQNKYGVYSSEFKNVQSKCRHSDSINQIKVNHILNKYGWVGKNVVGDRGNLTLFLVLQHSDNNIELQLKYLPLLKDAVKKGDADPMHLALLEDRIRISQGKKQLYGSQIGKDRATGKYFVKPIEDVVNVDKRRAEVGLGPLADYVKQWGIIWTPEKNEE